MLEINNCLLKMKRVEDLSNTIICTENNLVLCLICTENNTYSVSVSYLHRKQYIICVCVLSAQKTIHNLCMCLICTENNT